MSTNNDSLNITDQEYVTCNLCGSTNSTVLYHLKDWAYQTEGLFSLMQCECGLVYLNPRPTLKGIAKHYPDSYVPFYQAQIPQNKLKQVLHFFKWRSRCLQVLKIKKQGRILDVGCSSGLFLQALKQYGAWETYGVELNPHMAAIARKGGIKIVAGQLFDAHCPDNYFDVITLWDVLEHVHDPKSNLKEIHRILKPGGYLFISGPNLNSLDAKLFKQYWIGFDAPRHLYVYNVQTLSQFLNTTDFTIDKIYSFYGRYTTFALSLQLWLNQRFTSAQVQQAIRKVLFFPLWRQVTLPYFWILDQLDLGTIITVRAKREK